MILSWLSSQIGITSQYKKKIVLPAQIAALHRKTPEHRGVPPPPVFSFSLSVRPNIERESFLY